MFPPVSKKLLRGEGEQDSTKVRSSNTTRLRSNGVQPSPCFPRLDDSYPLAELETGRTKNYLIGSDSGANSFGIEHSTDSRGKTHLCSTTNIKKGGKVGLKKRSEELSPQSHETLPPLSLDFERQEFRVDTTDSTDSITRLGKYFIPDRISSSSTTNNILLTQNGCNSRPT